MTIYAVGLGQATRVPTLRALLERLASLSERLDGITKRLSDGEGTAGQLLRDKQLYENMNGAVEEMRSLIADIRRGPKKFLNVKVSLF